MKKSFTLIELLVVVAIIAVLVAILLPALAKARDSARKLVCQANVKGNTAAMIMYANDNTGRTPVLYYETIHHDFNDWWSDFRLSEPCGAFKSVGGLGYLVDKKYSTLETMFCPVSHEAETMLKKFQTGDWCDSSYAATYSRRLTGEETFALVTERYMYGTNVLNPITFWNHPNDKLDTFTTGYSDGSVKVVKDPLRINRLEGWVEIKGHVRMYWYYLLGESYLTGKLPVVDINWFYNEPPN